MMDTTYQKKNHSKADTASLVWRIAENAWETQIHNFVPNHQVQVSSKPIIDLHQDGYKNLGKTMIPTFNKKTWALCNGQVADVMDEEDELPPPDFSFGIAQNEL